MVRGRFTNVWLPSGFLIRHPCCFLALPTDDENLFSVDAFTRNPMSKISKIKLRMSKEKWMFLCSFYFAQRYVSSDSTGDWKVGLLWMKDGLFAITHHTYVEAIGDAARAVFG